MANILVLTVGIEAVLALLLWLRASVKPAPAPRTPARTSRPAPSRPGVPKAPYHWDFTESKMVARAKMEAAMRHNHRLAPPPSIFG